MLFRDTTILNSYWLQQPWKLAKRGRKMVVTVVIRADHYKEGNIRGTKNDPIALAIREKLDDDPTKHFACSVLPDEILLFYQGVIIAALLMQTIFTPTGRTFRGI